MKFSRPLVIYKTQGFITRFANSNYCSIEHSKDNPLSKSILKRKLFLFLLGFSEIHGIFAFFASFALRLIPFVHSRPSFILVENGILSEGLKDELSLTLAKATKKSLIILAAARSDSEERRISAYECGFHLIIKPDFSLNELNAQVLALFQFHSRGDWLFKGVRKYLTVAILILLGSFLNSIAPNVFDNLDSSWSTGIVATPHFEKAGQHAGWQKFYLIVTNDWGTSKHGFRVITPNRLDKTGMIGLTDVGRLSVGNTIQIEFWVNSNKIPIDRLSDVVTLNVIDAKGKLKSANIGPRR